MRRTGRRKRGSAETSGSVGVTTRSGPTVMIGLAPYLLQAGSEASEPRKPSSAGMAHLALPQRTARVVLPPALFGA